MSDFVGKQLQLFSQATGAYQAGRCSLDEFLSGLESPLLFITPLEVRAQLDDVLFEIEAIKAISAELKREITPKETAAIGVLVDRLASLVDEQLRTRAPSLE